MSSGIPTLEEWVQMAQPHFDFLVERGFHLVPVPADPALEVWGPRMQYLSDSVGVRLHCSIEFDRVEASIIRLVDARVPPYPIFMRDDDEIYWFHLDGLLNLCEPGRGARSAELKGLDEGSLRRQLAFVADALGEFADELLDAASSTLRLRQQELHELVRAHPPIIRIHVPVGASADEVAQGIAKAKESSPGIDVEVDRYV